MAELLQNPLIHGKVFGNALVDRDVVLGEVEESILLQQAILELVALDGGQLDVGGDPASAVDRAPAVGQLNIVVLGRVVRAAAVPCVIVVIERNAVIVALDQAAAGGVILGGGQGQAGVFRQRVDRLHQPFAKRRFSRNQATVVILNRSGDDFGRRGAAAVYQHHQRKFLAAVAVLGMVDLLRRITSVMRDNHLPFAEKLVGDADALAEQAARILPQVKNQAVQIAHGVQRLAHFLVGGFLEAADVEIADARADHEMQIDAVARNFIAYHGELERFVGALAEHRNFDRGAFGPFQQFGHFADAHIVRRFAVDDGNDVAWTDAGPVRGSAGKGRYHDDLVIARANLHANSVILAALLLAKQGIRLRIEEIGVRVEHAKHSRDGSVVNRLVGVDDLGIVLLDDVIDLGERAQTVANVTVIGRRAVSYALSENHAQTATKQNHQKHYEKRATRTTSHPNCPSPARVAAPVRTSKKPC